MLRCMEGPKSSDMPIFMYQRHLSTMSCHEGNGQQGCKRHHVYAGSLELLRAKAMCTFTLVLPALTHDLLAE